MSKPDSQERLEHIRSAILKIKSLVSQKSLEDFVTDSMRQGAVMYELIIIGEDIRQVDESILNKYEYPWYTLLSFKYLFDHEDHNISMESIFKTLNELDELLSLIEIILIKEF